MLNGRYNHTMPYPEPLIAAMRQDLTRYGVEEARTPQDVDRLLGPDTGAVLMIVNSVCGCAAGRARPAVGLALQHAVRPSKVATVFAGGDDAAVAHLRARLSAYPPSSPSMALFQDGEPVYMLHRGEIERREPAEIAGMLTEAFDQFCMPRKLV
jgi:putative YphP/YqiW family bacilliredoxin